MATINVTFVDVVCAHCGVFFAMTEHLDSERRKDGGDFYCPNGHQLTYGESEAAKLRRRIEALQAQNTHLADQRNAARADADTQRANAESAKGELTRHRKRAANGVCPCCNRSFVQLTRHMRSKHPDYVAEVRDA